MTGRAIWIAALASVALAAAGSARAATYTFTGSETGGVDALGGDYVLGVDPVGFEAFSETAAQQPDDTQDVTFHAGMGLADATSFTLTETGTPDALFQGGFDSEFVQDIPNGQIDWTETFVGDDEVAFTAPAGDALQTGDQFFVNIPFQAAPSSGFSYTITWGGDASGAPEPAAWTLMIAGLGGAGAALRRSRRKAAAADANGAAAA